MRTSIIILSATFVALGLTSCGSDKQETEPNAVEQPAKQESAEHGDETLVGLTDVQMKTIGVEIGTIEQKQLTASLKTNGVLRVPNQNKARINSVYPGVIKTILILPGSKVKKGQIIATVSNPQFILTQEEYLGLDPRITLAQQELTRQKELNEGNAGALKNLQAADANLKNLVTRRAALEEQLRLMGLNPSRLDLNRLSSTLNIKSPNDGVVSSVLPQIGSFVDTNTPIVEIVDNSQLHLDLFVFEKDLSKLKENQTIHFTLTNNPGREYDAEIFSLGSSFEDESKAVSVHAIVKGDKAGLIDGMTITALISLEKMTAPAVPTDAIATIAGQDYIFAVKENANPSDTATGSHGKETMFEKMPIAKGTTDVGYTQITLLKELQPGSKIVTKGAFFVAAKLTNTGEEEH